MSHKSQQLWEENGGIVVLKLALRSDNVGPAVTGQGRGVGAHGVRKSVIGLWPAFRKNEKKEKLPLLTWVSERWAESTESHGHW